MKIIKTNSYEEMSLEAAKIIADVIKEKEDATLGLATGSTPIGTYKNLIKMYEEKQIDFSKIRTVNLDEYIGLPPTDKNSYKYFMNENLFDHININKENTNLPNGMADDPDNECERYKNVIDSLEPVDVQVLGVGHNGHIGFNEPGESFESEVHVTNLTDRTIEANKRFFDSIDDVPKKAITMGIATIMRAKKIILIASGEDKAEILSKIINGDVTENVPASILQKHPDCIIIADSSALSKI